MFTPVDTFDILGGLTEGIGGLTAATMGLATGTEDLTAGTVGFTADAEGLTVGTFVTVELAALMTEDEPCCGIETACEYARGGGNGPDNFSLRSLIPPDPLLLIPP